MVYAALGVAHPQALALLVRQKDDVAHFSEPKVDVASYRQLNDAGVIV